MSLNLHFLSYKQPDDQPEYCEEVTAKKVSLSVFYESTSELSKHFFTTQYGQWYINIEEIADIQLYPAGNVKETQSDDGTCDSNADNSACMANKLMAIIIEKYSRNPDDNDYIDGSLRTMLYHTCYFNQPSFKENIYDAAEYCTNEVLQADEWVDLDILAKSAEGGKMYAEVVKVTDKLKTDIGNTTLSTIPWVSIGDSPSLSRMALNDLLPTVCALYAGVEKPQECRPVEVTVFYSAKHAQSRRFFVEQLRSNYWHLRGRIHFQLVPYGLTDASQTVEEECNAKPDVCKANKAQVCSSFIAIFQRH